MLVNAVELGTTPAELSRALLEDAAIAATPMTGWGGDVAGRYVRLVFSAEPVDRLRTIPTAWPVRHSRPTAARCAAQTHREPKPGDALVAAEQSRWWRWRWVTAPLSPEWLYVPLSTPNVGPRGSTRSFVEAR
jgi:hypothetical protein